MTEKLLYLINLILSPGRRLAALLHPPEAGGVVNSGAWKPKPIAPGQLRFDVGTAIEVRDETGKVVGHEVLWHFSYNNFPRKLHFTDQWNADHFGMFRVFCDGVDVTDGCRSYDMDEKSAVVLDRNPDGGFKADINGVVESTIQGEITVKWKTDVEAATEKEPQGL